MFFEIGIGARISDVGVKPVEQALRLGATGENCSGGQANNEDVSRDATFHGANPPGHASQQR